MTGQPTRDARHYTYLAAAIVLAAVVLSASLIVAPALETTRTSTETSTATSVVTFTNVSTTTATQSTVTISTNFTTTVNSRTTVTAGSPLFQPCNSLVWNESSPSPSGDPVLLMSPNSTGYVCVTYVTAWSGDPSRFVSYLIYFGLPNGTVSLPPFQVFSNPVCITPTCGISHSFNINVLPSSYTLSNNTNYFTVVYVVHALSNSTGFYDISAPGGPGCTGAIPLAVGYSASQVNASDFTLPPPACPAQPVWLYRPVADYAAGMGVVFIKGLQ